MVDKILKYINYFSICHSVYFGVKLCINYVQKDILINQLLSIHGVGDKISSKISDFIFSNNYIILDIDKYEIFAFIIFLAYMLIYNSYMLHKILNEQKNNHSESCDNQVSTMRLVSQVGAKNEK